MLVFWCSVALDSFPFFNEQYHFYESAGGRLFLSHAIQRSFPQPCSTTERRSDGFDESGGESQAEGLRFELRNDNDGDNRSLFGCVSRLAAST